MKYHEGLKKNALGFGSKTCYVVELTSSAILLPFFGTHRTKWPSSGAPSSSILRRRKKDFVNDYFMICALEDAS